MRYKSSSHRFFSYHDKNGKANTKLGVRDIMRLLYVFIFTYGTVKDRATLCGESYRTVLDWDSLFREVCAMALEKELKIVGTLENL